MGETARQTIPNEPATVERGTMTIPEFCTYLGVSYPTALTIINRPDFFPGLRIGRKRLIVRAQLDRWLAEHGGQNIG